MPDGAISRPKLRLMIEDGVLLGFSSFRPGTESSITNASLKGDEIRFQVIRERNGQQVVTTYSGKWSGKRISGKIESNWAGEKQSYAWEAEKTNEGAEGIWKWPVQIGQRRAEVRINIKQDGEKLTGGLLGRGGRGIRLRNGSIHDNEIQFEIDTGVPPNRNIVKYSGKQNGDTIKGSIESTVAGKKVKTDWEAKRVE